MFFLLQLGAAMYLHHVLQSHAVPTISCFWLNSSLITGNSVSTSKTKSSPDGPRIAYLSNSISTETQGFPRTCALRSDRNSLLELGEARSEINMAELEHDVPSPWWRPKICHTSLGLACWNAHQTLHQIIKGWRKSWLDNLKNFWKIKGFTISIE